MLAVPNNDLASFPKLYEENAEGVGLIRLRLTLRAARGSLSRCARLELRSNPTSGMGPAALDLEVPHGGRGGIRTHGTFYRSLDFESSAFDRAQPPFLCLSI